MDVVNTPRLVALLVCHHLGHRFRADRGEQGLFRGDETSADTQLRVCLRPRHRPSLSIELWIASQFEELLRGTCLKGRVLQQP